MRDMKGKFDGILVYWLLKSEQNYWKKRNKIA